MVSPVLIASFGGQNIVFRDDHYYIGRSKYDTESQAVYAIIHKGYIVSENKPVIVMIGADKGGVGKTTVCRALLDWLD